MERALEFYGDRDVPNDVRKRRRQVMNALRRVGTPVIVKHMYNIDDIEAGIAQESPNFSSVYKQTRHNDPISHGIGFCSIETSDDEWVSPTGQLVTSPTKPGEGYIQAPKYRGFGPGYLTYAILPDASQDIFKLSESGVLIRVQEATAQMAWYPEINDNDLIIVAQIDRTGNIIQTRERFQAKQTNPISMRGHDRRGRLEATEDFGNRHVINQQFQMTRVPSNDALMSVEVDR